MFLRSSKRKKNGKTHVYWNIVENKRLSGGRVVQRQVLYLGEINSSQLDAWRRSIGVIDEANGEQRTLALFPEDRNGTPADATAVQVRLSEMRLCRPRQWGACWLAGQVWRDLKLDEFWAKRLPRSRKGTRWDQVLQVLVSYRLIAPGSEWRLHRDWFGKSAMADLLGADFGLAESHKLYACHDRLLEYKQELFSHLTGRWRDMFNASFDVLLYDLTSTYFEIDAAAVPEGDKRRHGYSRDKRPDCPQVVIALVVTPDGLPLAYEVLAGNTSDCKTLRSFLDKIEAQYGKARRVWVMDRGIPTEEVLAEMRQNDPPVHYLVGTPKGRLTRLEKQLTGKPWQEARQGVQVKLLAGDGELYVFAQSDDRIAKERAMPAADEMVLETPPPARRHGRLAGRDADEAWRGARQGALRLAAGRDRDGQGRRQLYLQPEPQKAAEGPAARGPVSAQDQPRGRRPGSALAILHAAYCRRRSVQTSQGRSRAASHLP